MTNPEKKIDENSNTGFMFGLTLGAAVGALSAILINKNSQKEVVQNFESKVKDFFQDLVGGVKDIKEEKEEKNETVHLKSHPKMFVKPKR